LPSIFAFGGGFLGFFVLNGAFEVVEVIGSGFGHYGVLLSQDWHLVLRVNILFGFISWWQREQFLFTIQKTKVRVRRRLIESKRVSKLFMVCLLLMFF